ncbi:hypothetical protein PQX77_019633 [Marasmius sp. AFHP31]|nr:hypothetical protein PQX77_019633 [Marasmius sp. AFHP31]
MSTSNSTIPEESLSLLQVGKVITFPIVTVMAACIVYGQPDNRVASASTNYAPYPQASMFYSSVYAYTSFDEVKYITAKST